MESAREKLLYNSLFSLETSNCSNSNLKFDKKTKFLTANNLDKPLILDSLYLQKQNKKIKTKLNKHTNKNKTKKKGLFKILPRIIFHVWENLSQKLVPIHVGHDFDSWLINFKTSLSKHNHDNHPVYDLSQIKEINHNCTLSIFILFDVWSDIKLTPNNFKLINVAIALLIKRNRATIYFIVQFLFVMQKFGDTNLKIRPCLHPCQGDLEVVVTISSIASAEFNWFWF